MGPAGRWKEREGRLWPPQARLRPERPALDDTVSITGTGAATVTGNYPNFNVDVDITPALPKFITNVDLFPSSNTSGSSIFNTFDISQYVPLGAINAILFVEASSSDNFYLDFRKDSVSNSLYSGGVRLVANGGVKELQLIVPISSLRKFQYYFGPIGGGVGTRFLNIKLVGYY